MGLLRPTPPLVPPKLAPAIGTAPIHSRCEACRREPVPVQWVTPEGEQLLVCINPTACRMYWPAGDANE